MASFSFIKTSILIFAYLFLWYQTNYHHQVSALSTLNDDDVSDSNSLYSSEDDINNGNGHLKTLGSDGPHVPHKGYGDYHPPLKKGGGEPSVRRGKGGTSPPFGGQYPHPTSKYGTPKKNHVTSNFGTANFGTLKSGTPKNKSFSQRSKRVKDVLKALWKKCVCQGKKHPRWMMFFAVVIMVIIYFALAYCASAGMAGNHFFLPKCGKGKDNTIDILSTFQTALNSIEAVYVIPTIIGLLVIGALFGFYCWKWKECNKREKF
ncbi:hypothetical protein, conserved in P.knowlesi [Plasmodium knowlesi strain H]|uniref:Uncharacterized protein n=3 Tax=Plasmodium knowlesi TaxID=5850 RepID=A0A5K1UKK9_PLAKH|nr:uncharacterized protein PKNH_0618800 [Plasmodium knowlesi strain H]OTN68268.1 Uncharacterized protein PKNOH_S03333700 [Plasmodium knowlesi]CAA9987238.1 hypothetical protein, conserved in P.knowlesi [Plasmodium knowlesi strain H]SBO24008.1 hypothetical protein, conserved in P.knowlesi [Plasmodium knowlesi strain H]SBO26005.1 hypothetical protein, conserved in P.knowlesi [Plasmodium knowlesi strain H]VVS76712.1 hypothetical protein, conserved in P.knowlesi [Plasmodium knowlesi strain H]|eukprot:XP_002261859.1 [Plasmodium knowlesi strain H]